MTSVKSRREDQTTEHMNLSFTDVIVRISQQPLVQCRTTDSSEPTEGRKCGGQRAPVEQPIGAVQLRNKRWRRSNTEQPLPFDVCLKRPHRVK